MLNVRALALARLVARADAGDFDLSLEKPPGRGTPPRRAAPLPCPRSGGFG